MIILALGGVVMCVLAGVVFWLWLKVTDGEVGPALVATGVSLVVIVGAMLLAIKIQEPRQDSWLKEAAPGQGRGGGGGGLGLGRGGRSTCLGWLGKSRLRGLWDKANPDNRYDTPTKRETPVVQGFQVALAEL